MPTLDSSSQTLPKPYAIHWFRRDLRVAGNAGLQGCWERHQGRVVGLFTFDRKFLSRPDFSANRFAFFLETLRELQHELRSLGSDLLVVDARPGDAFQKIFAQLSSHNRPLPDEVSFCRDYEPFARERDRQMLELLTSTNGINVVTTRDHLVIEPDELQRGDDGYYQVYTPFSKRWYGLASLVEERGRGQASGLNYLRGRIKGKTPQLFHLCWKDLLGDALPADSLMPFIEANRPRVTVPIPKAGSLVAYQNLKEFFKTRLNDYVVNRDFPDRTGTSRLSIYLKNGSLTVSQILGELDVYDLPFDHPGSVNKFIKELVWREFYYHLLWHRPDVETQAFQESCRNLNWENRSDWFECWKSGTTGFPIVDAGMRQLRTTGWMHNRVRMIVASFLTKDLLIDWRWGEQWFMEQLLDGDLALNNGGWQWAASTGCDAQPWFRIFNPWLQGKKFDPEGFYIRTHVPELATVEPKWLHSPEVATKSRGYPKPIVDHAVQREKSLAMFRACSSE